MIFRLLLLCLPLFMFYVPKKEVKQYKITGLAQGTDYSIMYFAGDSIATKSGIDSLLDEVDLSMSLYKKSSLINQFNQNQKGLKVDYFLNEVLKRSFEINRDTKGV
ncbi:MAG: FAD:protein FMN transferase, partial [Pedobacter sp.]